MSWVWISLCLFSLRFTHILDSVNLSQMLFYPTFSSLFPRSANTDVRSFVILPHISKLLLFYPVHLLLFTNIGYFQVFYLPDHWVLHGPSPFWQLSSVIEFLFHKLYCFLIIKFLLALDVFYLLTNSFYCSFVSSSFAIDH